MDAVVPSIGNVNFGLGFRPTIEINSAYTATSGEMVRVSTESASVAVTLPANPIIGSSLKICVIKGHESNVVTLNLNGNNLNGSSDASSISLSAEGDTIILEYIGGDSGWSYNLWGAQTSSSLIDLADYSPVHWYNFESDNITTSGSDITGVTDLGSGSIDLDGTGHAPLLVSSSANFNSQPVAQFDGSAEYLLGASNMTAATAETAVFVVGRYITTSVTQTMCQFGSGAGKWGAVRATSSNFMDYGSGRNFRTIDTNSHIFSLFNTLESANSINTALPAMTLMDAGFYEQNAGQITANQLSVGSGSGGGEKANCEIAEVVLFAGQDLSLADCYEILAHFSEKYDITLESV